MPLKMPWWSSIPLKTGQTTCYLIGDDGDCGSGFPKGYEVLTTGQHAGNSDLDVAHYAAPTISFTAPNTVSDAGAGLVTILAADTIVIKGSTLNDGVWTVLAGGVAGSFTTVENTVVNEGAGAYVSLYKRAAHANVCVWDRRTGRMWSRTTSSAEKVGPASNGLLNWYDAATCFTLHPAAADLAIVAPNILRIVGGAGELARYHIGDVLDFAGFATAENNTPGFRVTNVAVNGADLDISLHIGNRTTLTAEAAGGARSISLVCRSALNYAAAANAASLGGYTDWNFPNRKELDSLLGNQGTAAPDGVALPEYASLAIWSSTTRSDSTTYAFFVNTFNGSISFVVKTTINAYVAALVRGDGPF